jgi:signal transduction histidine kinase
MRSRLVLLVAATTSLVLVAFLIPLALLVRTAAATQAVNSSTVVTSADGSALADALDQANTGGDYQFTVFLPDGSQVGAPAPRSAAVNEAATGSSLTTTTRGGREVLVAVAGRDDGVAVIRTFVSGAQLSRGVSRAWLLLGLLGLGLLLLSVLVADQLGRSLVRPLVAVAKVSHRLAGGDLEARAEPGGPREVNAVGAGLNLLAERIGALLAHERETAADLSHRLRTPLTALRIDVESVRDPADRERLTADIESLARTVDSVIRAARAPAPESGPSLCDAAGVVAQRVRYWSALAEEEGRPLSSDIEPGPVPVRVSRDHLAACVDALLGNVFAHTPEGAWLHVMLHARAGGGARLVVSDGGPGLPDTLVPQRGTSHAGSTGLGLDIARRTAAESGGTLQLGRAPGGGAVLTVEFGPAPGAPLPRRGAAHSRTTRSHQLH